MERVPISSYLDRKDREKLGLPAGPAPAAPAPLAAPAPPAEDLYAKGLADGREQAKAACDEAIAREQGQCRLQIELARKVWTQSQSEMLANQISGAISVIGDCVSDALARILKPLAAKHLVEQALAQLAEEVQKLLSQEDAINIKISGPADLIQELRNRLPPGLAVTVQEGDKPEVTLFANKTVIETRLSEWLVRIGVCSNAQGQDGQGRA